MELAIADSVGAPRHPLNEQGFIEHAPSHPLVLRRRPAPSDPLAFDQSDGTMGLSFYTQQRVPAGTRVFLDIPARETTNRFEGTVVFVRESIGAFELGVWLDRAEDAERLVAVERRCAQEREQGIRPRIELPAAPESPLSRWRQRAQDAMTVALERSMQRTLAQGGSQATRTRAHHV